MKCYVEQYKNGYIVTTETEGEYHPMYVQGIEENDFFGKVFILNYWKYNAKIFKTEQDALKIVSQINERRNRK